MSKKKTFYLIDTENVGDRWIKTAEKAGKKDRLIAFYTENHSKLLEKLLARHVHDPRFTWLETASGSNALDYQLMGVLSYLVSKHPKARYCILSNDHGYEKAVDFWKDRGIDIQQDKLDLSKKKKKKKEKKSEKAADMPKSKKVCLSEKDYLIEIAKAVPASNLNGWYHLLTILLGEESGRAWYQKFREQGELRAKLSQNFIGDSHARGVQALTLVLDHAGLDTGRSEEIYRIIQAHNKKNLKAIKQDMDKQMGRTQSSAYYKALHPVLRLVKEL